MTGWDGMMGSRKRPRMRNPRGFSLARECHCGTWQTGTSATPVGAAELPVEEAFGLCGDGDIATPLSVHFSDPQHWNAALRAALDSGGVGYSRRGWIPGPSPWNDRLGRDGGLSNSRSTEAAELPVAEDSGLCGDGEVATPCPPTPVIRGIGMLRY